MKARTRVSSRRLSRRVNSILAAALGAAAFDASLFAASGTFTYTGVSGFWNNGANWLFGNPIPNAPGEIANFATIDLAPFAPAIHTVSLNAPVTVGTLIFADVNTNSPGGWLITPVGGSTLTLASTTNQPTITVNALGSDPTVSLVEIAAPIAGSSGYQKTGTGLLRLSGNNSLTGSITISGGTVEVGSAANLGASTDSTLTLNGGTLSLRSSATLNLSSRNLVISANSGVHLDRSVGDTTTTNVIQQLGSITFGSGAKSVTLMGSNGFGATADAIILSAANTAATLNNLMPGGLTVGQVSADNAAASLLSFTGTNNSTTGSNTTITNAITQNNATGTLSVAYTDNHTLNVGSFSGVTGSLTVSGNGTLNVSAGTLPTNVLTVSAGTLNFTAAGQTSTVAGLVVGTTTNNQAAGAYLNSGAGTLAVIGNITQQVAGNGAQRLGKGAVIDGNLDLGSGSHSFNIANIATLSAGGTADLRINAVTSGSGTLSKVGTGEMLLTSANALSAAVNVASGTLSAAALTGGNALTSGAVTISGGTLRLVNLAAVTGAGSIGSLTFDGTSDAPAKIVVDSGSASAATTLHIGALNGRSIGTRGALTIVPSNGGLGSSEKLTAAAIDATVGTSSNHGILAPYIVAQKSAVDTSIDFLTTSGSLLVGGAAVYQTGDINAAPSGSVFATTAASTLVAPKTLFALKADGTLANVSGSTLTLGDGSMAGLILNNGANISASGLVVNADESLFWAGGTNAFGSGGTISSAVTLNGATLTKQGAEALTFAGPINLNGNTRTFNINDGTTVISGDLANGTLSKSGPGNLVIVGNNAAFNGGIIANRGTIQIGQGASTPATGLGNAKLDAGNGTIVFNLDGPRTLTNHLTSSGTGGYVVDSPTGIITFNNATSNFARLTIQSGGVQLTADNQLPTSSTLTVQGTGSFDLNGRSQTIGALAGAAAGVVTNNGFAASTLTINIASGSSTYGGVIGNGTGLALNKNGDGTQILTGSNSFAGGTRLNLGTLQLQNNNAAGTGAIQFFNNGGALAIGSNITLANQLSIGNVSATVAVINAGSSGTLTGNIVVGNTGALNIVWNGTGQTLNATTLTPANFTGTLAFKGGGRGDFRIVSSQTAGSDYDLSTATINFGTASTTFGFNQGSVTVTMPYVVGGDNATIGLGANNRTNHYIFGTQGGSQLFKGALVNGTNASSEIIKTGPGSFTIASATQKNHSFSGDLRIQSGTFVLGQNAVVSGTSDIRLEGGNLAIAGNGTITSLAEIHLSNSGLMDVTQVPLGWSTPPTVTISGTGDIIGGYNHNAGTLQPGGANKAGTMTFSTYANPSGVTFGPGVVDLDIAVPGNASTNVGGGTNDLIVINGDVKFNPSAQFRVNYIGTSTPITGQDFPILYYSGTKSGWGSGQFSTTSGSVSSPFRSFWSLRDLGNGVIAARLDAFAGGTQSMKWVGTQSSAWDLNFTRNFQIAGVGTNFYQNDSVTFDNLGSARPSIVLSKAIYLPEAVLFNNGSNVVNYTLSGPGTIAGSTGLRMTGTGSVTIQTANTFTGNTTISSGVLSQGNFSGARYADKIVYSPFGLGTIYLGNVAGSATVSAATSNFANDIRVEAGQIGNFNADAGSISVYGAFLGNGTLNLTGNATNFNIFADNTASNGTVNVNGSSLAVRLGSPNAAGNLFWNFNSPRTLSGIFIDQTLSEIPIGGISGSGTLTGFASGAAVVSDKSLVIGSRNIDSTWNGTITNTTSGSGGSGGTAIPAITGLTKTGTASLILTGTNLSYTGDTVVRGGLLQLSNTGGPGNTPVIGGGQMTGARAVRVQSGGTFRLGAPGGDISTAGTITTAGTQLLLNADAGGVIDVSSAYDADFDITAFTSFATRSGVTWAGDGGTIVGNIRHESGTISPGRDGGSGALGTLNFTNSLRFVGGGVTMDVGSTTNSHDTITAGTLDLVGGIVTVNVIGNSIAANQSYTLMTAPNLLLTNPSGFSGLVLNGRGASGTLVTSGSTVSLKIITPASADTITWNGSANGTWDVKAGQNWINHTGTPDYFYHGDTVTFGNSGAGTVLLASSLSPAGEVRVDSSGTYTFSGVGKISGSASLHKSGTGMLVIYTDNDYTGGTVIDAGGTIALGRDNRFDSNGSYAANNSGANGALISANKTGSLGNGPIVNNGNLVFRKTGPTIVNQNISGTGAVYQADLGITQLNGTNTWSGGTTISLGTIKLGHANALPSAGSVTLLGTTNFLGGNSFSQPGRGGRLDLNGFAQTIEELNSIGDGGTPGAPMDAFVQNNATLSSNIATLTISRTGTLGFNSAIHNGSEGNNFPIGQIALVKQSAGVATMNYTTSGTIATNYSGRTSINSGTLVVRGSHAPAGGTSYGTYTIANGAALAGDGVIDAPVSLLLGGVIAPGIPNGSETGTLTVNSLSLSNAHFNFEVMGSKSDRINVIGENGFVVSGASQVNLFMVGNRSAGTFTLVDYAGAYMSNLLTNVTLGSILNVGSFNYSLYNNPANSSLELIITQPIVSATWQTDASGTWSAGTNWTTSPAIPNAFGSTANFGSISSPRTVTLDAPFSIGTANFTTTSAFTLAGTAATTLTLGNLSPGAGVAINVTQGSHVISVPLLLNNDATMSVAAGASLTLNGGFGLQANGNFSGHNLTKVGTGTLVLDNLRNTYGNNGTALFSVTQGTARISHKASANSPEGTVKLNSLAISSGAKLDVTNNSLILDYAPALGGDGSAILAQLRGWLNTGDGRLYSSDADATHALGYRDNLNTTGSGNAAVLNFSGISVDASSILIRYTYTGDTNVDGQVDVSDLYNLAGNYNPGHIGSATSVWQKGDFNYDGWVDLADLTKLATNWQAGVGAPLSQDLTTLLVSLGLPEVNVPEPSLMAVTCIGLTGLLARRRRREIRVD